MNHFEARSSADHWAEDYPLAYSIFDSVAFERVPDGTAGMTLLSLWRSQITPFEDCLEIEVTGAHFHGKARISLNASDLFDLELFDRRSPQGEAVFLVRDLGAHELLETLDDALENYGLGSVERFPASANPDYQYMTSGYEDPQYQFGSVNFNRVCEQRWNSLYVSDRQKLLKRCYPGLDQKETWNFERKMWTGFNPEQRNNLAVSMYLHLPTIQSEPLSLFAWCPKQELFVSKDGRLTDDLSMAFHCANTYLDRQRMEQFLSTMNIEWIPIADYKGQAFAKVLEQNKAINPSEQDLTRPEVKAKGSIVPTVWVDQKIQSIRRILGRAIESAQAEKIAGEPVRKEDELISLISSFFEDMARALANQSGDRAVSAQPDLGNLRNRVNEQLSASVPSSETAPSLEEITKNSVSQAKHTSAQQVEGLLASSHRFLVLQEEYLRRERNGIDSSNLIEKIDSAHISGLKSDLSIQEDLKATPARRPQ